MAETVLVEVSKDRDRFTLKGGDSRARDELFGIVTAWPGWRRLPVSATIEERSLGCYTAPIWTHTAISLAKSTLRIQWGPGARELVDELLAQLRRAEEVLEIKFTRGDLAQSALTDRAPRNHQRQAVLAAEAMGGRLLLSDDMGLGKTSAGLWLAEQMDASRILVVCPASVKFNWQREVHKTLGWDCYVIDGTRKQRANVFAEIVSATRVAGEIPLAVIINYDLLIELPDRQVELLGQFVDGEALLCDEGHYLKGRDAGRTKFVLEHLAPRKGGAKIRILMSGTPVRNMVDDLWSQIEIIRPGTWTSYWDFAKRHLDEGMVNFGGPRSIKKVFGGKNIPELNRIVNTMQIRRLKEDVAGLPPKIHTYPELELKGDHLRVYKAMKELAVLELEELDPGMTIFSPQAKSAVIAALRCEQIAQGFVGGVPEPLVASLAKILGKKAKPIPGRPHEIIFPDSPKLVWLIENLTTLFKTGKRPVIASRFNAPMFWLAKHFEELGRQCMVLHGGLTSKAKDQTITSFQAGDYDMMLMQVKMAEGFNLHASQDIVFLGRDWSPAINMQAEDRLHRIGQKGTVNVQIPIVRNTIEALLHKRLMAKTADANQALKSVTVKELIEAL
jgi:SWI/SNF-related matrix-associated actin-dependent regulator 1 of chromatin subfamily A